MSKFCELTGKQGMVGNRVSKALNRTKRRFEPNLTKKKFYIPEDDSWITLRVSASAIKTVNKNGISKALKDAREKGFLSR